MFKVWKHAQRANCHAPNTWHATHGRMHDALNIYFDGGASKCQSWGMRPTCGKYSNNHWAQSCARSTTDNT